jgi:hypothetical protein
MATPLQTTIRALRAARSGFRWASHSPRASISIGDKDQIERTFTQAEVNEFAKLSGDTNPIHLDENYAKSTKFGKTVVHGVLINGYKRLFLTFSDFLEYSLLLWELGFLASERFSCHKLKLSRFHSLISSL